ncbi:MAG: S1 RNA-binding domain-containing protein [Acidimicrobiales bacterium]
MVLEGVVTNVAAFGAFVDVGVHQDGLVHVSAMSRRFVSDPRDVVKPGDVVKVKVMDVDLARKRISLSLRLDDEPGAGGAGGGSRGGAADGRGPRRGDGDRRGASNRRDRERAKGGQGGGREEPAGGGAMADALRRAGLLGER